MDFDKLTALLDLFAKGEVTRSNMLAQIKLHADERVAAERERLAGALTLAANRLERLSIEVDDATRLHYEAKEWAKEARKAVEA